MSAYGKDKIGTKAHRKWYTRAITGKQLESSRTFSGKKEN